MSCCVPLQQILESLSNHRIFQRQLVQWSRCHLAASLIHLDAQQNCMSHQLEGSQLAAARCRCLVQRHNCREKQLLRLLLMARCTYSRLNTPIVGEIQNNFPRLRKLHQFGHPRSNEALHLTSSHSLVLNQAAPSHFCICRLKYSNDCWTQPYLLSFSTFNN